MAPRTIRTAQPATNCDVCGRTLLAGERSDVFLHGGRRRTVCELCTARAAHDGWIREGLDDVTMRHRRGGRSRGLFGKLIPRRADPVPEGEVIAAPDPDEVEIATAAIAPLPGVDPTTDQFLAAQRQVHAVPTNADVKAARALELFNASEHPRRIAGISRSLGAPSVSVRPSPTEGSVMTIVVGWELSWYRYEVDLGNEAAGVRVVAQGSLLDELEPGETTPNAAADERGGLILAAT